MNELLIGTSNNSKIVFYKAALKDQNFKILTPRSLSINLKIDEDLFDIVGNSIKKATTFAKLANLSTLSDDTGIYIPALKHEPGVAVRRWAGKLPENISDENWLKYFKIQINKLDDNQLDCYKHQVICIALPNGSYAKDERIIKGKILKNVTNPKFEKGAPFSAFFFLEQFKKTEARLTKHELEIFTKSTKIKVFNLLNQLKIN